MTTAGVENDHANKNNFKLLDVVITGKGSIMSRVPVSYTHLDVYKRQLPFFCTRVLKREKRHTHTHTH